MPTAIQPTLLPSQASIGPDRSGSPGPRRHQSASDFNDTFDQAVAESPRRPQQAAARHEASGGQHRSAEKNAEAATTSDVDPSNESPASTLTSTADPTSDTGDPDANRTASDLPPDGAVVAVESQADSALLAAQALPIAPNLPYVMSAEDHVSPPVQTISSGAPAVVSSDVLVTPAPPSGFTDISPSQGSAERPAVPSPVRVLTGSPQSVSVGAEGTITPSPASNSTHPTVAIAPGAGPQAPGSVPSAEAGRVAEPASSTASVRIPSAADTSHVSEIRVNQDARRRDSSARNEAGRLATPSRNETAPLPPAVERAVEVNQTIRSGQTARAGGEPAVTSQATGNSETARRDAARAAFASTAGPLAGARGADALPVPVANLASPEPSSSSSTPQVVIGRETVEPPVDSRLEARLETEKSMPRVMRGLRSMVNQRGGTLTMRLDPAELGELRVQMTLSRNAVTAQFFTAGDEARLMLEKNIGTLRSALEQQGLTVQRLSVNGQQESPGGHMHDTDSGGDAEHDAGQGESRGRHDDGTDEHTLQFEDFAFDSFLESIENTDLFNDETSRAIPAGAIR